MVRAPVRRGGRRTPRGFLFEVSGGDPSLDFVNTVDLRPLASRKELLATYADVPSWARQAGLLTREQEAALVKKASRDREAAERARKRLVEARECLFQVLIAFVEGKDVPGDALDRWNRLVRRAAERFELVPLRERFAWRSASDPGELDFLMWTIVHAAVALLTGPEAPRIRSCASESCDWMFLDRSRRGNRRWCDMTVCGNRAKARRFYARRRARS